MLAAVASPLRVEIVELLDERPPLSVSELAALLDRPATALYYHLEMLEDAGWLQVVEGPGPRRYRRAPGTGEISAAPYSPQMLEQAARVTDALLRKAGREFRGAAERGIQGKARRARVRLTPEQRQELLRRLDELARFLDEVGPDGDGDAYSLTFVLTSLD